MGASGGVDRALRPFESGGLGGKGKGKSGEAREKKIGSDDEWVEAEGEVNGEEMRKSMENWMKNQAIRAGVAGLGFLMAVVGVWGDGA